VDYHGEKRSNQTHESKTDPEAVCRILSIRRLFNDDAPQKYGNTCGGQDKQECLSHIDPFLPGDIPPDYDGTIHLECGGLAAAFAV